MEPSIEILPFNIQMLIMQFKPRLILYKNVDKLTAHLRHKYCRQCGEYIDVPLEVPALHAHFRDFRYKYREYKYLITDAYVNLNMTKPLSTSMLYDAYKDMNYDIKTGQRIVYRKRGPQYFYNFKRLITLYDRRKCDLMINTGDMNIFTNPDCYVSALFEDEYMRDDIKNYWQILSPTRSILMDQDPTQLIHNNIVATIRQNIRMFDFFLTHLIQHFQTLVSLIYENPEYYILVIQDRIHSRRWINILEHEPVWIRYFIEDNIQLLFKKYRAWVLDWYSRNEKDLKPLLHFE